MSGNYRPDYENGCKYKFGHKTKGAALKQTVKRRGGIGAQGSHKRLGAYHCVFCGLWHVGKSSGIKSRKLKPYNKSERHRKGYN